MFGAGRLNGITFNGGRTSFLLYSVHVELTNTHANGRLAELFRLIWSIIALSQN